jgi:cytidylate kinase
VRNRTIVAIDGPAGAGKSTVAKLVASQLGVAHIDTGATYRLVALRALEENVGLDDVPALEKLATHTMERCGLTSDATLVYEGHDVGPEVRTAEVSRTASIVAAHPEVRAILVVHQRRLVPSSGAVVEGRDIGTVVWPNADLKVYLDARSDVRAQRRTQDEGTPPLDVEERDRRDATRPVGAMQAAPDAVVLDTSDLSPEDVAQRIVGMLGGHRPDLFYATVRGVLAALLRGIFRMEIVGAEHVPSRGPVILAPNHRSLIDIPVAAATTRRKVWFMGKEELFRSKLSAALIGRLGGFQVRRGRPDRSALHRSLELLASGEIVGIFPEGTRRPLARFEELEEGFAYVALKSGAPIVPVAISGTEAIFPPGRRLPQLVKIRVAVGEPFRLGERHAGVLPRARIRAATVEAQQRLSGLIRGLEPQ